ncbi:SMI1/KNR4 family protein [Paenibacillus pinisoli]|uniref:SMI1/KNR4 family protein n=1 Tax=Paenibacillus pinisoli TaxID=1276110 RepID=A0A3A6PT07_9BACL|nr:SMI1/KNR4 family protein [Paenibacillus pinisoli]RJX37124.1 SMI1/KNR4 family protein [Paenibacillus pinisoli]
MNQSFPAIDHIIEEMRSCIQELQDQDPQHYSRYPMSLAGEAEEQPFHNIVSKYALPEEYLYFLKRYAPQSVTWSTGDYVNLDIFGAMDLERGQWGYSHNPETNEVFEEWPSHYLVIASDEGDPYCIDLSRGDTVVYAAEHGTGSWDFDIAYDNLTDFLRSVLLPPSSSLDWDTDESETYTYYKIFITGEGSNKLKTLAFIKKKFSCDYAQARAYMESMPLLVYKGIHQGAENVEAQLKEIGAEYEKREISLAEFIQ